MKNVFALHFIEYICAILNVEIYVINVFHLIKKQIVGLNLCIEKTLILNKSFCAKFKQNPIL